MEYPIKVLIMDTVMDRGGSEAMTMEFMRHMDSQKVQYDFLVHRNYRGAYEDEIEQLGGKIYRICPMYPQNIYKYKKMIRNFFRVHQEYKIIHSNIMELGYIAYREAKKVGIPVIIVHSHNTPKGINIKSVFRWYFKNQARRYATDMFACSEEAGVWLFGEKNKNNIKIINNAIDAKKFIYNKDIREKIRRELGIEKDDFVVGHVGRFFLQKNHKFIVDIFKEVYKKNPNSKLVLVGEGEHGMNDVNVNKIKEKIRKLGIEEAVIFTGARDDVSEIMQAFDVFLFPSHFEGFGIVLIEAQAAGLHCIASEGVIPNTVKISELLHFKKLSENSKEWAKKVLLYNNGYKRKNMYDLIVNAGFDIENNAKKMQEFYLNSLNR